MSDNDITIKPQVGVDITESIENIVALRKYLDGIAVCRVCENLLDLRGENEEC